MGTPLNLERAMKLNARMEGHLVTGHVDGIGTLRAREQDGNAIYLTVEASGRYHALLCAKGSITMDGISLTINSVTGAIPFRRGDYSAYRQ